MDIKCPKCNTDNPSDSKYCKECAALLPSPEDISVSHTKTLETPKEELTRGTTFAGRYEIIEELGTGGMGKVYRVEDKTIKEEVALKLLIPEIALDKKTIERFSNELKIARKISHRNVCTMYDLNEEKGTHFITMEYISGEDLKSLIRRVKQLTIGKAISITKQICEGLAEAHRLSVIHRDLKPGNIMIDKEGNARIMDFGIARSIEGKGITGVGVMIGTPEYMSPEQAEGMEVNQSSDLYSLGVILYEMVTGQVPFEGDTPLTIAVKHMSEIPKDPKELNAQVPEELNLVIMRCLEKDKEKRYQSADQVIAELDKIEEVISGVETLSSKREVLTRRGKKIAIRKHWGVVAVLVVALGIAGVSIQYFMKKPTVLPERNVLVVLPFENLGHPEDEYFADGITEEITSRLAALHGLGVISRTSAIQYKDTKKTIKQIGDELNVDYVLDGSVRWNRNPENRGRVRVTPQLIRASDDTNLWSERYDRVIEDIFSVQSEIAEQVAQQLDLTVLEPERRALNARPTESLEAYDFYLKGREHEDRGWAYLNEQEFELAVEKLERATEIDPGFALAYVRKSYIHSRMYFFGIDRTQERLARSRTAVNRALELQPDLPEASRVLGFYYYWCLSDYNRAAEIFETVQKARPNFDPQLLGYIQRRQGKWEQCVGTLERAFRINPRDTQIAYELGGANLSMHRYEQAEKWFNHALSIYPDHLPAQLGKTAILILSRGDTEKAQALLKTLPQHQLTDYMWFTLNMLERNYKEVLNWLASLSNDSYEDQHFYFQKNLAYASVYHAMKDLSLMKAHAESARPVLEKAVRERAEDPRFHAALGLVYAYLDDKEEAIQEGNLAAKLHPVSKDAAQGPIYLLNLAKIYAIVGEYEMAIDRLKYILSIPHAEYLWQLISLSQLKLDPQWDSLRDHPEFRRLLGEE